MGEPSKDKLFTFFSEWIVSKTPNDKGEYRMFCPLHEVLGESKTPSATINFAKGFFHCNAGTGCGGMTIQRLKREVNQKHDDGVAAYDPFAVGDGASVVDLDSKRAARKSGNKDEVREEKPLTEALVKAWHRGLLENKKFLEAFTSKRGLTEETIKAYEIGLDLKYERYIIPIRDANGVLVNARKYKIGAEASQKMWNHLGMGSPPRLFPFAVLHEDTIVLCEGELDALICIQHGVPAMSGTGGAGRWDPSWSKLFTGKHVVVYYDNDRDGRLGAKKVQKALQPYAESVRILSPPMEENKSDATDFFAAGGTGDQLRAAMAAAPLAQHTQPDPELAVEQAIEVMDSMDAKLAGKPLAMTVSVTGFKHPTYQVPHKVDLFCTMDAGPKCKSCCMLNDYEGETQVVIDSKDAEAISRFVDALEDRRLELLRKQVGAQRCSRLGMEYDSHDGFHTVNEVFIATNVDRHNSGRNDYTQRRVYVVGNHKVDTNSVATVRGTTWPNPKDARNEFYAHAIEPATTSIDTFAIDPDLYDRLRCFQVSDGQRPIDKAREIAEDLSKSVTKIRGRERLQMCMDLVFHSVLNFEFEDKVMDRGWLEFIVVGDTRTGKSATAIALSDHYRLGHVIGCEGATFAGLIGGVKQIGKEWSIQWGEVTINDRRLVVLDEASGLSKDIIGRMSDVRSRGVAQVTAIETRQTKARCRMIWISNPRPSKFVDEKRTEGIDILEEVVGNPEDIARFDFAMSVRSADVPSDEINVMRHAPEPKYTSDLCHNLVLWAWSRKPEHVVFTDGTIAKVFEGARWLGERYMNTPPLVQGANVKEKLVRMAVALAARTFSTDATGTQVVVTPQHVVDVTQFLHKLYQYENFGYHRRSQRVIRNRETARSKRMEVRAWLRENPRILEFLLDRTGSFRSQDLEEMAFMQKDEVNMALGILADAKMISKDKSQIIMEPELQDLLKEMEKRKR